MIVLSLFLIFWANLSLGVLIKFVLIKKSVLSRIVTVPSCHFTEITIKGFREHIIIEILIDKLYIMIVYESIRFIIFKRDSE